MPLSELAMSVGRTSIRPGNTHEWEAVIVRRRYRLYKIKISRRAHIRGNLHMSTMCTPSRAQPVTHSRSAERGGKRSAWSSDAIAATGFAVPIARTIEVRPRAWS